MSTDTPELEGPDILDADEEMEASRAPLLEHLTELRSRLIVSVVAIAIAALGCFVFVIPIYNWLAQPFVEAGQLARGETEFDLIFTGLLEFFFAKLKISIFAGLFLAFPIVAWQIYAFVAPGLYKEEKGAFVPFLIAAPILFTVGALFVYYVMLPWVSQFAFSQEIAATEGGASTQLLPRVAEYLSLAMALMLAFGVSFQLPVVLTLLGKIGVVGSDALRSGRKYALVVILGFAAFFTPPDIVSQVILTVPVMLLYESSIWCVWLIERGRSEAEAAAE